MIFQGLEGFLATAISLICASCVSTKIDFQVFLFDFNAMLKTCPDPNLQPWHFAIFSNTSLKTFVPNWASLTYPSLQTLGKTQTGIFPISRFLVNIL